MPDFFTCAPLGPAVLMLAAALLPSSARLPVPRLWRAFLLLSALALVLAVGNLFTGVRGAAAVPWLDATPLGLACAVLVQLLGTVISAFSARYLDGEPAQQSYVAALGGVLSAVHVLLLADHWVVLIGAWSLVGVLLQRLLCCYPDRPFALLAAHKKHLADRLADLLLVAAAALAWQATGSGSFADLWAGLGSAPMSPLLQLSAVCLVLGVILRTALMPAHGWLVQVMEAPTPVSALLHAGVVNLGGFVLIRFAPLLDHATVARWLLVGFGLVTAVLAGLVMLTRVSIKVRLAWSTVAQMGFMLLECGLGLYSLAALHLIGHSLYKVHAFLSASSVVRQTRLRALGGVEKPTPMSLLLAPLASVAAVIALQKLVAPDAWPWWWSSLLGLAWAPLLWRPLAHGALARHTATGLSMIAGLGCAALLAHRLPLGLQDRPDQLGGTVALAGMALLYLTLVLLQLRPHAMQGLRRWSYAGFYADDIYTGLVLRWPRRVQRPPTATVPIKETPCNA
jgi:NAD(P)H-quinone oxidoreductase subunit 5